MKLHFFPTFRHIWVLSIPVTLGDVFGVVEISAVVVMLFWWKSLLRTLRALARDGCIGAFERLSENK